MAPGHSGNSLVTTSESLKRCGSPGGHPLTSTSTRIKLRDGKLPCIQRRQNTERQGQELMEKLGMYLVSFDRSEYGESDPNPRRDVKSKELDIKKMADQLDLGQKLYVLGSGWEDTLFEDASSIYLTGKHIDTTKYMLMKYATQNSDFRVKLYMLH
ncbi:unnamed protein product [Miscanthus lutarioriparius]|uniref:Uncharacterized protein n=1 Tax=Miscanthus lutarioriparius TaxID=422564 RepID=A0A811Q954_9POAL|nr:unnamed protein product [Miscanthus lutarioriparius]